MRQTKVRVSYTLYFADDGEDKNIVATASALVPNGARNISVQITGHDKMIEATKEQSA